MFAQIKHMAIVSSNVNHEGDFYKDIFGMKRSGVARTGGAVVVRDGYIGLNLNPRAPGRQAGFDHFGFEVQDVELVFSRLKEKYPKVQVLKRPGNRPFAGISTHDPAGNVFDLSQQGMENRTNLYVEEDEQRTRVASATLDCASCNRTKSESFTARFSILSNWKNLGVIPITISPTEKSRSRSCPGKSADFLGSGIERPALDHIGFKVESMAAFKADWEKHASTYTPTDDRPDKNPERESQAKTIRQMLLRPVSNVRPRRRADRRVGKLIHSQFIAGSESP